MKPITLSDEARAEAVTAIQTYTRENFDEPLGTLGAGFLLDFFLEELAPSVYNRAIRDAQEHIQARLMDMDMELGRLEFPLSQRRRG